MKRLLLIVALLTLPIAVEAKTAKELFDACQSKLNFSNGQCFGYIEGFLEGDLIDPVHPVLSTFDNAEELRLRFTDEFTLGQLERTFVVYVTAHPEQESHSASSALVAAWMDHKMVRLTKRGTP